MPQETTVKRATKAKCNTSVKLPGPEYMFVNEGGAIGSIILADNYVLFRVNVVHFPRLSPSPKILLLCYINARARSNSSGG